MMHPVRLVVRISEYAEPSSVREFVVKNIGVVGDQMYKAMDGIANITIAVKIVQATERANINLVKWKVRISQ